MHVNQNRNHMKSYPTAGRCAKQYPSDFIKLTNYVYLSGTKLSPCQTPFSGGKRQEATRANFNSGASLPHPLFFFSLSFFEMHEKSAETTPQVHTIAQKLMAIKLTCPPRVPKLPNLQNEEGHSISTRDFKREFFDR